MLEAKEVQKILAMDAAFENFNEKLELFKIACDQAEEFVSSIKQRISSECLVDEATGSVVGKPGQGPTTGLLPISAVRLEQTNKAVRWVVIELQNWANVPRGWSYYQSSSSPFDARFSKDSAQ